MTVDPLKIKEHVCNFVNVSVIFVIFRFAQCGMWNGPKWLSDRTIQYKSLDNLTTDLELKPIHSVNNIIVNHGISSALHTLVKNLKKILLTYRR